MSAISKIRLYGQIQKVEDQDDGTIMVHGIASTEQVDSVGEIVRADAMRAALPSYMAFPALREMHGLSAAGSTVEAEVDDDGITRIVAHVVDENAIKKIKTKTYRGFSIGGRVTKRNSEDRNIIEGITLSEISLVDRPANPGSVLEMWKADGATSADDEHTGGDASNNTEDPMSKKAAEPTPVAEAAPDSVEKAIPPAPINPTKLVDVLNDAQAAMDAAVGAAPAGKHVAMPALPGNGSEAAVEVKNPSEAGQASPEPLNATETPAVQGASAKADEAEAISEDAAGDDAVEKAEEEDPIALAHAAADNAMKAATAVLARLAKQANGGVSPILAPGMELRKGLHATARLGCLLVELAYCLSDAEMEKQWEGDESVVPAKLHAAVESLGAAYKAMSDEELQELLDAADKTMGGQIALAAAAGDISKALEGVVDADTLSKVAGVTGTEELSKATGRITVLEGERETLLKTVGALTTTMNDLAGKVQALEDAPLPAKTVALPAGIEAVSKADETSGRAGAAAAAAAAPSMTEDDVRKALDAMSSDERAAVLMKAALSPTNARVFTR